MTIDSLNTSAIPVVVQSPKKNTEITRLFIDALRAFDCFGKIYLATDQRFSADESDDIDVLQLERDYGASGNFLEIIPQVEGNIILVVCDDHIVDGSNKIDRLRTSIEFVKQNPEIGYLRLTTCKRILPVRGSKIWRILYKRVWRRRKAYANYLHYLDGKPTNEQVLSCGPGGLFVPIPIDDPFYVSLQPGIWRKDFFTECLRDGEDAWQFEERGPVRARKSKKYKSYAVTRNACGFHNVYAKGSCYHSRFVDYVLRNDLDFKLDRERDVLIRVKAQKPRTVSLEDYIARQRQEGPLIESTMI